MFLSHHARWAETIRLADKHQPQSDQDKRVQQNVLGFHLM
jgi:hypothetical protein